MPEVIENYTPQIIIQKQRRQALFAWIGILLVSFLWMFSIISAPIARANGFEAFANPIYKFFSYLCHQMSWRSYHIYEYPFAVCARCFGFYGGFFLGLIIYPFFRALNNTDSYPRFWLFLAMIPMGLDWGLEFLGFWENTHISRLISGGILGAACAFFMVPALVEISYFLNEKFQRKQL